MKLIDLTLPTPAENLACDEALLDLCEGTREADDILRFWEPREHFVVVGYGNRVATEVNLTECQALQLPVLRRCSGGGTVVQGPGCLNYSLILRIDKAGALHTISSTNQSIMERHRTALGALLGASGLQTASGAVEVRGHTDLTLAGLKFSGNSQRRRKRFLLFHGAILLGFDLALIDRLLPMPSKQPAYRANRPHRDFVTNLPLPSEAVKGALQEAWHAFNRLEDLPCEHIAGLVHSRYATTEWNFRI
jgi:lipoate---protein ligase